MHRIRMAVLVGTTVALVVVAGVPTATAWVDEAGPRRHVRSHSFEGTCSLEGTVTFSPGATFVQQVLTLDSRLSGTCSGTLDGGSVSDAPVQMHNSGQSSGSCAHAETLGPGPGTLTFVDGPTIHYTFEFNWVGTDGVTRYFGRRSGFALSHGTFRNPGLSGEGADCAGAGVTETGITINLATESPLVSDCKAHHGRTRCRR